VVAAVKALLFRIARERIVHFMVLGAVIFAVAPKSDSPRHVSISSGYLDSLHVAQAERLGVTRLSPESTSAVDRRAVEDEVLYREALRLGLDRDDGIVRQHLIQKMLILAEDLSGASREPTPEEIEAYFDANRARYRVAESMHAIFVFGVNRAALARLGGEVVQAEATRPGFPPALGDAFPRSRDVRGSKADFAASFDDPFADAISRLPVGTWSDPLPSRFGFHLVKVLEHDPGRAAELRDVVDKVRLACAAERRQAAIAGFLRKAFARYEVDIAGVRVKDAAPTPRLALRTQPSRED
jgi:peptidyl-prolyl cis-trans isomerase C